MREIFEKTKLKLLIVLLIIFVITPMISVFFYPSYAGGTASGSAEWENKITWGIYPFVFMGVRKSSVYHCNFRIEEKCKPTESINMAYTVYGVLTGGGYTISSPMDLGIFDMYGYSNGRPISAGMEFFVNILINLVISTIIVFFFFFIKSRINFNRSSNI